MSPKSVKVDSFTSKYFCAFCYHAWTIISNQVNRNSTQSAHSSSTLNFFFRMQLCCSLLFQSSVCFSSQYNLSKYTYIPSLRYVHLVMTLLYLRLRINIDSIKITHYKLTQNKLISQHFKKEDVLLLMDFLNTIS